jgi:hypothetical protein
LSSRIFCSALELATNFKFNLRQKIFQENKKIIKTNNRTNTKDLGNKFEETIKQFIFFRKVKRFLDDKKLFYICGVEGEIETCFLCYGHIILWASIAQQNAQNVVNYIFTFWIYGVFWEAGIGMRLFWRVMLGIVVLFVHPRAYFIPHLPSCTTSSSSPSGIYYSKLTDSSVAASLVHHLEDIIPNLPIPWNQRQLQALPVPCLQW